MPPLNPCLCEYAGVTCFYCPGCPEDGLARLADNVTWSQGGSRKMLQDSTATSWSAGRLEVW